MTNTVPKFPIVGVGASAGGIAALEGFFKGIPADPGLAIVVVTHISPERESQLAKIIQHFTPLTVLPVEDGLPVERNHVYVLSHGSLLTISQGVLAVEKLAADRRPRKIIDVFLGSLATDQGESSVSVILSGSDGDGALGTKAIKEAGGLTIAQASNGDGPGHPEMPNAAIATGFVDFTLPVGEIGTTLLQLLSGPRDFKGLAIDPPEGDHTAALDIARSKICDVIRSKIGHDFSGYKLKTFIRRVYRRMQVRQCATFDEYLKVLEDERGETEALFRDLLINVTAFFRDEAAFESLAQAVVPKLFEGRGASDLVRVWVPGCSTGEEVYSIAILLLEHVQTLSAAPRIQIFATDIADAALSIAREGRYPEALLASVSPERKKRFFSLDAGSFMVTKELRDLCIFSSHSVIRDPPFSRIDLVSCRNLLIYLGPAAQSQVIPIFHYSLKPGGYLFLGMAENVTQFDDLFTPVDKQHRIFRSREVATRRPSYPMSVLTGQLHSSQILHKPSGSRSSVGSLQQVIESQVLERHAPAYLVANTDGDVLYFSTGTGRYLEAPAGAPTRNIFDLARRDIRFELTAAFREAVERNSPANLVGVIPQDGDRVLLTVNITVEPLWHQNHQDRLFLVLFDEQKGLLAPNQGGGTTASLAADPMVGLQNELRDLKHRLQATIEEYETSLEELKSTNEELTSVNEELQSTNEELEASKEEQQSVNEELQTLNTELGVKVDALDTANSDLRNLFDSTQIAIIFLERDLTIRSFTPAMTRIFSILPGDRGRSIKDLASKLDVSGLEKDMQEALAVGTTVERAIHDEKTSTYYLMKTNAYRSARGDIEGVVVTFIDVTRITQAEAERKSLLAALFNAQKMETVAQLTGAMAHDFNNLLHVIMMTCQALELQRPDDAAMLAKLATIRSAVRTGSQIIGSLLAVARQQPLKLQLIDVRQVLEDNRDIIKSAVSRNIQIEYKLPTVPLMINADAAALASAILNLAINARDAMPDGGKLTVSCAPVFIGPSDPRIASHQLVAGEYAEIDVSDTGTGISQEAMSRAFEPYFTTKERGKGTGLGLPAVDGLCRQLHGAASLRNNDGGGLTVQLVLPRSPSIQNVVNGGSPKESHSRSNPLRILVVDDDQGAADSLGKCLRSSVTA